MSQRPDLDREQAAACENAYQEAMRLGASHEAAQQIADLVEEGKIAWEEGSEEEKRAFVKEVLPS